MVAELQPEGPQELGHELEALSGTTRTRPAAVGGWSVNLDDLRSAAHRAHSFAANAALLVGDTDLASELKGALAEVTRLPSPFRP